MTINDLFRNLADKHNLIVLSVGLQRYRHGGEQFTAMAHWYDASADYGQECAQGQGETPEAAISTALARANEKRAQPVAVPTLEIGEVVA